MSRCTVADVCSIRESCSGQSCLVVLICVYVCLGVHGEEFGMMENGAHSGSPLSEAYIRYCVFMSLRCYAGWLAPKLVAEMPCLVSHIVDLLLVFSCPSGVVSPYWLLGPIMLFTLHASNYLVHAIY